MGPAVCVSPSVFKALTWKALFSAPARPCRFRNIPADVESNPEHAARGKRRKVAPLIVPLPSCTAEAVEDFLQLLYTKEVGLQATQIGRDFQRSAFGASWRQCDPIPCAPG